MAEQDTGQERTEEATPKRQQEAREKGQIARSRELNTMLLLLAAAVAAWTLGPRMIQGLLAMLHAHLSLTRAEVFGTHALTLQLRAGLINALSIMTPFFVIVVLAALLAPLAMGGWGFSGEAMAFKWDKLDPVKGLTRVFAWRGLVELIKALAKFILVGSVALLFLYLSLGALQGLGYEPLYQALGHTGHLFVQAFIVFSAALILIAAADVPFQLWDHKRQIKMTRQEIKDEFKQSEGSPESKARVRRMQQEMAQRRMMSEVPKADVIVTNPQHYAVALRYDQAKMSAPVVVAKGADLVAAKIRGIATKVKVPIVSAPPLARAIFHTTEINAEVPAALYMAVAQVLAYVFQLRQATGTGASRQSAAHAAEIHMDDLPIPDDLHYDS